MYEDGNAFMEYDYLRLYKLIANNVFHKTRYLNQIEILQPA